MKQSCVMCFSTLMRLKETSVAWCSGYYAATLMLEIGWLQRAYHYTTVWLKKSMGRLVQRRHTQQGYEATAADAAAEAPEDEDVQEERTAVQAGTAT